MKLVHITAHMGAGAGKAISGLAIADKSCEHSIIVLQKPDKINHIQRCIEYGIKVLISPEEKNFEEEITRADIVIVDWWHHPIVYEALMKISTMHTRVVLWSHVNGLNYPKFNGDFLSVFDACLFTTEASLQCQQLSDEKYKKIKDKSTLVYGIGDFVPNSFSPKGHYNFSEKIIVGYVGSLDYAKLHPDFAKWIKEAAKMDDKIQFVIAGDCLPKISADIEQAGMSDRVTFLGFRKDIPDLLKTFDLFMYPLNKCNFATTENALLEAMAVGLPIITSDGIIEKTIIEDGKTGMIVCNEKEFAESLKKLIQVEEQRKMLGTNAREFVIATYDVNDNLSKLHEILETVMRKDKVLHEFNEIIGEDAFGWFINGCGEEEKEIFKKAVMADENSLGYCKCLEEIAKLKQIYKGQSKGSAQQFYNLYPVNRKLAKIVAMINEGEQKS